MERCIYYLAMVLSQLAFGASSILSKFSLSEGLNPIVYLVYRHVLAVLLLAPVSYFLERKERPALTLAITTQIFVLALLGITIHLNVFYAGLAYTSPTVGCALGNIAPSLTFLSAVLFRMEKVKLKSKRGQAKVLGALVCIGGSLTFTFWKGGYLFKAIVDRPLLRAYNNELQRGQENWVKGSALILTSHVAWSSWMILQCVVTKAYPAPLSLTTLMCFFASVQSSFLALFFARHPALWILQWDVKLLAIVYGGVVISALVYYLQIWCIRHKGPVYAAMFMPLQVISVALFSAIAFAERLHLGSLIGAFLIIAGLYFVLWGKKEDGCDDKLPKNGKGILNGGISINDRYSDGTSR